MLKSLPRECLAMIFAAGLFFIGTPVTGAADQLPAEKTQVGSYILHIPQILSEFSGGADGSGPALAGCPIFPEDNIWNTPVDTLPVDANSDQYIQTIGARDNVHADFGSGTWDGGPIGIPFVIVPGTQPGVDVVFDYWEESDPGLYPIPTNPPIEGGADGDGDRHILILEKDNCILYELYHAYPQTDSSWTAG